MRKFLFEETPAGEGGGAAPAPTEQTPTSPVVTPELPTPPVQPAEPAFEFDMPKKDSLAASIVAELSKPTEGDMKAPTTTTTETIENIRKEVAEEKKTEQVAEQKAEPEKPALTAADFALNKMFAKSIVSGIDDINSWGCKVVSDAEKKDIFRAAAENKEELALFMVLVMEKMGGKVPLWLYGIWLTGKTFAPPWLMVVEMRQLKAENAKLRKQAAEKEAAPDQAKVIEIYRKEMDELKAKLGIGEIVETAPAPARSSIEEIKKKLDASEKDTAEESKALNQVKKTIDLKAPFGRDDKGEPFAPFGKHADGTPKRSAGGRKKNAA